MLGAGADGEQYTSGRGLLLRLLLYSRSRWSYAWFRLWTLTASATAIAGNFESWKLPMHAWASSPPLKSYTQHRVPHSSFNHAGFHTVFSSSKTLRKPSPRQLGSFSALGNCNRSPVLFRATIQNCPRMFVQTRLHSLVQGSQKLMVHWAIE